MNNKGITLLFSDLEGTILQESDGKCNNEFFYLFLDKLNEFEKKSNTQVVFNIVSPLEPRLMLNVIAELNLLFKNYNKLNHTFYGVDCAACEDNPYDFSRYPNYIFPCLSYVKGRSTEINEVGKENFVRTTVETLQTRKNIDYCIYMGNDRNDIKAMEYLKNDFKENAIILCPENSRTAIRQNRNYFCGKGSDLVGITDAFNKAISNLFKELNIEENNIERL